MHPFGFNAAFFSAYSHGHAQHEQQVNVDKDFQFY